MATDFLYRTWDLGQQHLAAGRYLAARHALESAEALAWRNRDAQSLARLYLPLLEARRQIRYHAVEGVLVIPSTADTPRHRQQQLQHFLNAGAGTILLTCDDLARACRLAGSVQFTAQRTGRWLEALLLLRHGTQFRVAAPADPTFAAGLPIQFTANAAEQVGLSTDPALSIPLPAPGLYTRGAAHMQIRESLLIAWEALALKWQHRHPPPPPAQPPARSAWNEIAWLRLALRVDPACEPVSMRLIRLAEEIQRL